LENCSHKHPWRACPQTCPPQAISFREARQGHTIDAEWGTFDEEGLG